MKVALAIIIIIWYHSSGENANKGEHMENTVIIKIQDILAKVDYSFVDTNIIPRLRERLSEAFAARPDGFMFMGKYRNGTWDGFVRLYNSTTNTFPAGLADAAEKVLLKEGASVRKIQMNTYPETELKEPKGIQLRSYQKTAALALLKAKRGIAHIATNGGKTFIFTSLLLSLNEKAVVIVHSKELLYQVSEVISKHTNFSVGLVGDGHLDYSKTITVAIINTLYKHVGTSEFVKWAKDIKVLVIDECHHTKARTVYDTTVAIPAIYRFGFSGTPFRFDKLDDLQLVGVTGSVVARVTNEELIEMGYSAKPLVNMVIFPYETRGKPNYQDHYREVVLDTPERSLIIAEIAKDQLEKDRVILILTDRVEHQHVLMAAFDSYNLDYTSLNGRQATGIRLDALTQMRTGEPHIYIATPIFDEGVDVPDINTLIIASPFKSHIRLLQRIGRGLRQKEEENVIHVFDIYDDDGYYLNDHAETRKRIYEEEGFDVQEISTNGGDLYLL